MAGYAQTALFLCSVKSGFTPLVNKRALHIISTPCVLHRHAQVSKVLPEYLKIVLKHVTERVNFIKAKACLYEVLCKDELIGLQCFKQCFIPNSHFATVSLQNVLWRRVALVSRFHAT